MASGYPDTTCPHGVAGGICMACEERLVVGPTPAHVGVKHDQHKEPFDLLPWKAIRSVVRVLGHGARKYAVDNWRIVPNRPRRYLAAAMRHLVAHAMGEVIDPESGEPHLAHAACCILFLLDEVA